MKILYLGPPNPVMTSFLQSQGDLVLQTEEKIDPSFCTTNNCEFLLSFGYRHILRKDILTLFPNRAINLHISYLPWNRGADPNFWSLLDNTAKGTTIHFIDEGIDTGDIIAQTKVQFPADATLASSYQLLKEAIEKLFFQTWPLIKSGKHERTKQGSGGSVHKAKDREKWNHLLTEKGWNTPIHVIQAAQTKK